MSWSKALWHDSKLIWLEESFAVEVRKAGYDTIYLHVVSKDVNSVIQPLLYTIMLWLVKIFHALILILTCICLLEAFCFICKKIFSKELNNLDLKCQRIEITETYVLDR